MGDEADAMWDHEMIDEGYDVVSEMILEERKRARRRKHKPSKQKDSTHD